MATFIHSLSDVQSKQIGEGTRIWQYAVILPNAKIGCQCNICSHCFIENDVYIGDRVTVKPHVAICDGVTLEDDVFIGPLVSFTNDRHPKSGDREFKLERTLVRKGATIGGGSIILPGVEIGEGAIVGAGSIVTKNVPPDVTVIGNPARRIV